MFNGLTSTMNPNYQFWDCTKAPSPINSPFRIALTDDCAPFQFVVGGGGNGPIYIELPVNPAPGKTITVKVERGTVSGSYIPQVYVRDPVTAENQTTTSYALATMSSSQQCVFVYIPEAATVAGGTSPQSGWVSAGSFTFGNNREGGAFIGHGSAVLAGAENKSGGYFTTVCGGRANTISSSAYYTSIGGGRANNSNGAYATLSGGYGNTANGMWSTTAGGIDCHASGMAAANIGGYGNRSTGNYSTTAGGSANTALGDTSATLGGHYNTATGEKSTAVGGGNNTVSGFYSTVVGGSDNRAIGEYSMVAGGACAKARNVTGIVASSASQCPTGFGYGYSQTELLIVGRTTSNDTPAILTSNDVGMGVLATNQLFLPTDSAYHVRGCAVSFCQTTGDAKQWTFECLIKNVAGAVSIVGSPSVTSTFADTGASGWSLAISADTTNTALQVTVTGDATNSLKTVCRLESTEASWT